MSAGGLTGILLTQRGLRRLGIRASTIRHSLEDMVWQHTF
jgi:hypothetical protein